MQETSPIGVAAAADFERAPALLHQFRLARPSKTLCVAAALFATILCHPTLASAQAEAEEDDDEAVDTIVVQATRSGRQVQDEPIRVEVVPGEEITEKAMMTPGSVAMLVNETGGVRLQVTSPALGAARISIQGMSGRYTQLLADGLPLYGGQSSSFGLLQIPPTDLSQVEVIKGAASALYGPSALGGVINLVSRRPGLAAEAQMLANLTSRDGQDLTAYVAGPVTEAWGASIIGGFHRQSRQDLDGDGWADMPGYERWTLRPRLFWEGSGGANAFVTAGAMQEDRGGGTSPGRTAPDGRPFVQAQNTRRLDAGLVAEAPLTASVVAHFRASAMRQEDERRLGAVLQNDRQTTLFAEVSGGGRRGATSWLAGAAIQRDAFRSREFSGFDYTYTAPALFAQVEQEVTDDLTLAASARWDFHSEFGSRASPRVSLLYRPGPWKVRASLGGGFYAPTPFVEEIEDVGLARLNPLGKLKPETAQTASVDVGYAKGPFETYLTLFGSNIRNAVRLDVADATVGAERVRLINLSGPTRARGAELMFRYRWGEIMLNGSYVYVDATEPGESAERRTVPLRPRHTGGLDFMWERRGKSRLGAEAYYTGRQALEDNPYRMRSRPYLEVGFMGELIFGRVSLFVNLENVLDVRQTKYDPMLLQRRSAAGSWTVDAWGPSEGLLANAGVRLSLGGS